MRRLTEIIVHCTATREGKNYTVEDVRRWHKERGFLDIGYHYVIYLDGSVHEGRPIEKVGAHCEGHNASTISIAYVGGLDKDGNPKNTLTPRQEESLYNLILELMNKYPSIVSVSGHRAYAAKACPCFDVPQWFNLKMKMRQART
jgi:N-acetylmuramoyl-L-alanine amidase